jgi:hypothetical protein
MRQVRFGLTLAVLAALAACSDSAIAPRSAMTEQARPLPAQGSTRSLSAVDTLVFAFTINPGVSATYDIGAGNKLTVPAQTLCDPATASYGPTEWDKPCPLATTPVTVTFRGWLNKYGHPHIDFEPNLRFETPSNGGGGWVSLSFSDAGAWVDPTTKILYCTTRTSCIDESITDLDVKTNKGLDLVVWRKIKHFSGYNVATGENCTPSPDDPDCIDMGDSNRIGDALSTLTTVLPGGKVKALIRTSALASPVSASVTVGYWGGMLSLPAAGLRVVIPPGAVSSTTTISVTARAGKIVAYQFEPHGIRFNVPLVFDQDLSGTAGRSLLSGQIQGAYFANDTDVNDAQSTALAQELLNANVGLGHVTFLIQHFSGYMLATGQADE